MPYVICAECQLTTYSAALWSVTEECPKCGSPLPVRSRAVGVPLARDMAPLRPRPTTARVLAAIRHLSRPT